jgi:hypothetical protein
MLMKSSLIRNKKDETIKRNGAVVSAIGRGTGCRQTNAEFAAKGG